MSIVVYTKSQCPNCEHAKQFLKTRGVVYTTINVEEDPAAREKLVEQGLRSVPQIYSNGTLIPGGYAGMQQLPEAFWDKHKINPTDLGSL